MQEVKINIKDKSKIKVDKNLDIKYKDVVLFPEKYTLAMEHLKNRDLKKEIETALAEKKILDF